MTWKSTDAMKERTKLVLEWERRWNEAQGGNVNVAELCRMFGVSRQTGYTWINRYRASAHSLAAVEERSRRPKTSPTAITPEIEDLIVTARKRYPKWGPRKLHARLVESNPGKWVPSASVIAKVLKRRGMTTPRRRRRRAAAVGVTAPFAGCDAVNDVWCIDFKGWFLTGDGKRCEPLTLTDAHSRYLLRCQVLARTDTEHVWPVLDAAFREFGLPHHLRSDNGSPFASRGAGGLSRLSIKLIKAGVTPERIAPGKPQQNGRHERMHLTLLQDTATPPARSLREQLKRLRDFQRLYNEERPHQALGNATPADHYSPSPRRFDGILREPEYGGDHEVRRVRHNGDIRWRNRTIYVNQALVGEPVGLVENDAAGWTVSYGPIALGTIVPQEERLRKPKRQACGHVDDASASPTSPQAQPQKT
jgi:transposase InsO family protein